MRTDSMNDRMQHYKNKIREKFIDEDFIANDLSELDMNGCNNLDDDPDFIEEFYKPISNESILDLENTPDSFDPYINMELAVERGGETPEYARIIKRA